MSDYQAIKQARSKQRKNRALANEIFSEGPGSSLLDEIWGRHSPNHDFRQGRDVVERARRGAAVQLWRTQKRFELGSYLALCDALEICREHDWPLPQWLHHQLIEKYPQAIFRLEEFKVGLPRGRQSELTRIQMQKHAQIFLAINSWHELTPQGFKATDPGNLVRHPPEMADLRDDKFGTAKNNSERANLASEIFRRSGTVYRSSSPESIEHSLQAIEEDVEDRFGGSLGIQLVPQYYLWDAPFLKSSTLDLINSSKSKRYQV